MDAEKFLKERLTHEQVVKLVSEELGYEEKDIDKFIRGFFSYVEKALRGKRPMYIENFCYILPTEKVIKGANKYLFKFYKKFASYYGQERIRFKERYLFGDH